MEPKYIEYLTNTDKNFAYEELKPVAVALLTGFTPADINAAFDNLKISKDKISEEELIGILDDIARTKIGKIIDENDDYVDLRTFYDNDLSL